MIAVVATIETKPGCRAALVEVFKKLAPQVLAEQGCLEYAAMVDFAVSLPGQPPPRENAVTVLEKWESLDALEAHLMTPHMTAFRKETESLRADTKLQLFAPG
jgi:quinol monooxygenase YgiN